MSRRPLALGSLPLRRDSSDILPALLGSRLSALSLRCALLWASLLCRTISLCNTALWRNLSTALRHGVLPVRAGLL